MATIARERVGVRSDRRPALVAAAIEVVKRSTLDDLDSSTVAAEAGVSKALVYYYFPTHADLQAAVVEAAGDELLALLRTTIDPALRPDRQLEAGLDAAIAFVEQHPQSYASLVRGPGTHPTLRAVSERIRDDLADLLAQRMGIRRLSAAQRIVFRGYLALVEEAALHWTLAARPISRRALVTYCRDVGMHALVLAPGGRR